MLSLGAFAFAAPGMLALLLALPLIYWLLRMIPPLPKLVRFPAIRLLIGLEPTEQTPSKMPWWLLLLRLLLATALILAVARPLLNPQAELPGKGPLMLVIDDGWSSAPGWTTRIAHAERLIQRAERANRPVVLAGTAPAPLDAPAMRKGAMRPDEARTLLRAFRPKPWPTDRAAAAITIDQMQVDPGAYVIWLSDGLEDEGADKLTERLRRFDGLQVIVPDQATTPLLLLPPAAEGRDLKVQALRPVADGPRRVAIQAADEQGRTVARIDLDFAANATKGEGTLPAPPELRNRMARLDIEAQGGAGSMVLLDERSRRRPVAILGEQPTANGQPLMQEVYFLEKALDPYVSLTIGDRETVLTRNTAVLLIPDGAAPSAADREEIAKWIEGGGIAVRFAGPNLAAGGDTLVPTRLRLGDRALGGVMSWGQPTALAEFPANSPFLGIPIPKDVRISQQVLAEPTPDLADKTWARLTDGTPLVTAEKRGQGYLVLMHTTANTSWSNMALSGLFVNMLQRLVTLSRGVAGDGVNKALKPWRTLDGFGRLGAPPAGAQILPPDAEETFKPKPTTPPGLYGDENAQVAFNIGGRVPEPKPLVLPVGVSTDKLSEGGETDLSRWFLLAALLMLLADLFLSLWLRGLLGKAVRFGGRAGGAAPAALLLLAGAVFFVAPPDADAQVAPTLRLMTPPAFGHLPTSWGGTLNTRAQVSSSPSSHDGEVPAQRAEGSGASGRFMPPSAFARSSETHPRRRPAGQARTAAAQRRAGAEGLARHPARLHRDRRQGSRRHQQGGPRGPERDPAQPDLGRAGRSGRPRPREGRAAALSADLLGDHLDAAGALGQGLGGARPLPAHRRHPVHRHARPAAFLRPAGRRQSRPQAAAGRHRDAAAGRHAARPRAHQVVLSAERHAGPLAGRQDLDRIGQRPGE